LVETILNGVYRAEIDSTIAVVVDSIAHLDGARLHVPIEVVAVPALVYVASRRRACLDDGVRVAVAIVVDICIPNDRFALIGVCVSIFADVRIGGVAIIRPGVPVKGIYGTDSAIL